MTMTIFVLVVLERGQPTGEEFYFRELTSCIEYSNALNRAVSLTITKLWANKITTRLTVEFVKYPHQTLAPKYCSATQ